MGEHTGQILIQESFLFFNLYNVKILFLRYAVDVSICFSFDGFFFSYFTALSIAPALAFLTF